MLLYSLRETYSTCLYSLLQRSFVKDFYRQPNGGRGERSSPSLWYANNIFDHPRSGVVYNFGRVCLCLSVCLSVCQMITFESLDVESSYLHIRYISRE